MKLGIVLPQFRDDPAAALETARRADANGLDGVFVFDHLWPMGQPERPALHGMTLLGAVAAETERVHVGTLVARVSLLPDAVLVHGFETLRRIAGDRVIAGIGAGDRASAPENIAYGISFPTVEERLRQLADCARRLREIGLPTWIGGLSAATLAVAAAGADSVNIWGVDAERVAATTAAMKPHGVEVTWGGQVLVGADDAAAATLLAETGDRPGLVHGSVKSVTEQLAAFADAGATWAVCAPIGAHRTERHVELLTEVARALQ